MVYTETQHDGISSAFDRLASNDVHRLKDVAKAISASLQNRPDLAKLATSIGLGLDLSQIPDDRLKETMFSLVLATAETLSDRPLPKNPASSHLNKLKEIRRRITKLPEIVNEPSLVLSLGTSAHKAMQLLIDNRHHLSAISSAETWAWSALPAKQTMVTISDKPKTIFQPALFATRIPEEKPAWGLILATPVDIPPSGTDKEAWGYKRLRHYWEEVWANRLSSMPTPYQIEQLLQDPERKTQIVGLIESYALLLGRQRGFDFGLLKEQAPGLYRVNIGRNEELAVLNTFAIVRNMLALHENGHDRQGIFTEIPVGPVVIKADGQEILLSGGKIDRLEIVHFAGGPVQTKLGMDLPLSVVAEKISDEFGSQNGWHRRVKASTGGFNTRLGRNTESLIAQLEGMLTGQDWGLVIKDYKFPAGDGGWATVFDCGQLPLEEHRRQVQEYMFFMLAHLARLHKGVDAASPFVTPSEKIGVSITEIVDFAIDHGWIDRIGGSLEYQLALKTESVAVFLPQTRDELLAWAAKWQETKLLSEKKKAEGIMARALAKLLSGAPAFEGKIVRTAAEIPPPLRSLCFEYQGALYLNLKELIKMKFSQGLEFTELKTYNLWTTVENGPLRISIDSKKGRFNAKYNGSSLAGSLVEDETQKGVARPLEALQAAFSQSWPATKKDHLTLVGSDTDLQTWTDDNGVTTKFVSGKPRVCRLNPMTNSWSLDLRLLEAALDEGSSKGGVFGLFELQEMLSNRRQGELVNCPHPQHPPPEKRTPSAYKYEDHIHCFRCGLSIALPKESGRSTFRLPPPETVADFKEVSLSRQQDFSQVLALGVSLLPSMPEAVNYMQNTRHLRLGDIPAAAAGYIPPDLGKFFVNLAQNTDFLNTNYPGTTRLDTLHLPGWTDVEALLDRLPDDQRSLAHDLLTVGFWKKITHRGIFPHAPPTDKEIKDDRLSGRIIMPMHWFSKGDLVISNLYGRSVTVAGQTLANGPDHYKVPQSRRPVLVNGDHYVHPTPAGFWISETPGNFMDKINQTRGVVISEAPIDALSLKQLMPEIECPYIALCGASRDILPILLKWLSIKTAILMQDYDTPGLAALEKTAISLQGVGISVILGWDLIKSKFPDAVPLLGDKPKINDANALLDYILKSAP
jgi:hypothetical protein